MKATKEVWTSCKENYSKVGDAAQIYEIKMNIATTKLYKIYGWNWITENSLKQNAQQMLFY